MTTSATRWVHQSIGYLHQKLFILLFTLVAAVLVLTGSAVQGEDALGPYWDAVLAAAGKEGPGAREVCKRTDSSSCKASSSEPKPGEPSNSPQTTTIRLWEKRPIIATLWTLKNIYINTDAGQILANKVRYVNFYRAVSFWFLFIFTSCLWTFWLWKEMFKTYNFF